MSMRQSLVATLRQTPPKVVLFYFVINVVWCLAMAFAAVMSGVDHKWWMAVLDVVLLAFFALAAGLTHGVWRQRARQ
jgi:hypothetical protein